MLQKYEIYTYEILPIEIEIATGSHEEYPQTKTGYEFTIFNVYADDEPHHSDEWYETESEAVIAAEHLIDSIMSGQDREPDYDVQPYGQIDWEERRRMGE